MTARDLDEAVLHGILADADLIATAPAHLLAPHVEALEQARDYLTRAYEKARNAKVPA